MQLLLSACCCCHARFAVPAFRRALSAPPPQHAPIASTAYDAIVLGAGAFGSAAAYHLALQGAKVLALDQYRPAHPYGSSHGLTRIIRLAYFEGLDYYKLLKRSYGLFLDLQQQAGEELFYKTGMLDVGATFERSLASAALHNIPHEVLSASEVNKRFPGYGVPEGLMSLYQPDGGLLIPEKIIQAHCRLAERHGATLAVGDRVVSWRALGPSAGDGVSVTLASGTTVTAGTLLLCAGPWMSQLVPEAKDLCRPERQVVGWFDCPDDQFHKDSFPVFIAGKTEHGECYYGFPQYGDQRGFKLGYTLQFGDGRGDAVVNPDTMDRGVITASDEAALRRGLADFFPSANGALLRYATCMYTNTPDSHFVIDRHPRHEQAWREVILCSACSGHGFKMSSGVGQLLADMVVEGGRGSAAEVEELKIHRVTPSRPGHAGFISACNAG